MLLTYVDVRDYAVDVAEELLNSRLTEDDYSEAIRMTFWPMKSSHTQPTQIALLIHATLRGRGRPEVADAYTYYLTGIPSNDFNHLP
jgi:hypothetical protein